MRKVFAVILLFTITVSCSTMKDFSGIPDSSRQLILVITGSETSRQGTMFLFERKRKNWQAVTGTIPVCVGKNGLAWGKGLHQENGLPVKKEGDGKSPAGIYAISAVFGYPPAEEMKGLMMPYIPLSEMTECVDDVNSGWYNKIVRNDELEKTGSIDWNSSEKMRFMGEVYHLGAVVEHNSNPVENGAGSCIFLHIWTGPESYTAGCTAMEAHQMNRLAWWMDKRKNPVMVQLTRQLYQELKVKWGLPEVNINSD